jgi:hypothetical protein
MARVTWLLREGIPVVEIQLRDNFGFAHKRVLLADTGAGPRHAPFELVLSEADCKLQDSLKVDQVGLGGAISGIFPVYLLETEIPALSFIGRVTVAAVPRERLPESLDGIAAFRFLNSFTYGNFGKTAEFGLER